MRALIAPDKFKGSLTAADAAHAIERGLQTIAPELETTLLPIADGGEGTVDAVLASGAWSAKAATVRGPLGGDVRATFALRGTTALCEMATASGLGLIAAGDTRGALYGSSFGTGQLVRAALDAGATRIVLAIGGTATNDAGAGALQALGARLLDEDDCEIALGGGALAALARVDLRALDSRLASCSFDLATDVDHVLLGTHGASAVFGPQKGASPSDVDDLDAALARFADALTAAGGRDSRALAGSGAGGGIAFAFNAVARARMTAGFDVVAEIVGLESALAGAFVCLTGEGSIDAQTLGGKVVAAIAKLAHARHVPAYAFGGRVESEASLALAAWNCETIAIVGANVPRAVAMRDAPRYLERAAERLARRLVS